MQYFDFEIMGLKRKLPFVNVGDNLVLASFVVLSDTELIRTVAPRTAQAAAGSGPAHDRRSQGDLSDL